MSRLNGKVAIVTGGAGGIGLAIAEAAVREGARVVLVDLDAGALAAAARGLGDAGAWVAADVSREEQVVGYVRATVERFGGVDVLFDNAGIEGHVAPLTEQSVEDFDRVLAVNVRGVWLGIKHAAPRMRERGGGSVVVTSSVAGMVGARGLGPYVASKHAVNGLVRTAALELAGDGIRVNAVNPGPVENRMMRSIEAQAAPGAAEAAKAAYVQIVPLARYATNDEVARLAVFLASDDASYCTGGVYPVDGGLLAS